MSLLRSGSEIGRTQADIVRIPLLVPQPCGVQSEVVLDTAKGGECWVSRLRGMLGVTLGNPLLMGVQGRVAHTESFSRPGHGSVD